MNHQTREADLDAAEYALGLLSPDEAAAAETRLRDDPAFREAVARWQATFAEMVDGVAPVPPPAAAWPSLSRKVARLVPLRQRYARAVSNAPMRWLAAGLVIGSVLGAAAAVRGPSAFMSGDRAATSSSSPIERDRGISVAVLYQEDGAPRFVVSIRPQEQTIVAVPTALWESGSGVPCLWGVEGDSDPVFLARLLVRQPTEIVIPKSLVSLAKPGTVLVLTAEASGWDPASRSQGTIVAHGKLEKPVIGDTR